MIQRSQLRSGPTIFIEGQIGRIPSRQLGDILSAASALEWLTVPLATLLLVTNLQGCIVLLSYLDAPSTNRFDAGTLR
jgi:hypothetical protein